VKYADVSEVRTASIIRVVMEAVRTSETSVNSNETTQRCIPEDSIFHLFLNNRAISLKLHFGVVYAKCIPSSTE
jgi:hypothetical protein